jgi:ribosomal protein S18 acetylase RimI-like enzyme
MGINSTLRPATRQDLAAVRDCTRAAYATFAKRIGYDPEPLTTDYGPRLDDGQVWILDADGTIVGILVLVPKPDHLLVYSVAILPERQGEGHGHTMMEFAEARAGELGLSEVRLYTNEMMVENVAFYETLGYRVFDRRPHPMRAGSVLIHMRKDLAQER